jgi:hypothetical protein
MPIGFCESHRLSTVIRHSAGAADLRRDAHGTASAHGIAAKPMIATMHPGANAAPRTVHWHAGQPGRPEPGRRSCAGARLRGIANATFFLRSAPIRGHGRRPLA